jgi:hypothetical protein
MLLQDIFAGDASHKHCRRYREGGSEADNEPHGLRRQTSPRIERSKQGLYE